MTVELTPFYGGSKVRQAIGPGTGRWWVRLENGGLVVWGRRWEIVRETRSGPVHDLTWGPLEAPVPEWVDLPGESLNRVLAGSIDPRRITFALDSHGLDGPEVDEALGVADAFDTVVDSWEDGTAVPTVSEVKRLATLTGFVPRWFYGGPLPRVDGGISCGVDGCRRINQED